MLNIYSIIIMIFLINLQCLLYVYFITPLCNIFKYRFINIINKINNNFMVMFIKNKYYNMKLHSLCCLITNNLINWFLLFENISNDDKYNIDINFKELKLDKEYNNEFDMVIKNNYVFIDIKIKMMLSYIILVSYEKYCEELYSNSCLNKNEYKYEEFSSRITFFKDNILNLWSNDFNKFTNYVDHMDIKPMLNILLIKCSFPKLKTELPEIIDMIYNILLKTHSPTQMIEFEF